LFDVLAALDDLDETGGHGEMIVLAPVLVGLLCVIIVVVTWLGRKGVIGPLDALVEADVALGPIVAGLSLGAGAVHAAVIADHFTEYWLFGAFFAAAATFQVGWAIAYWRYPGTRLAMIAAALNGATILVWLWSRLVGLPLGPRPGAVEHVGFADVLATIFEAVLVGILLAVLAPRSATALAGRRVVYADAAIARTFAILAIVILTGAAIAQLGVDPT